MDKKQVDVGMFMATLNALPGAPDRKRQAMAFALRGDRLQQVAGPAIRDAELRASLIEEEARETAEAIRAGDLVEAIDGLCDLLYVIYGAAVAFGVDLDVFFGDVHRSNMTKMEGASFREDGKLIKGPGFEAPNIASILRWMYGVDGKTP